MVLHDMLVYLSIQVIIRELQAILKELCLDKVMDYMVLGGLQVVYSFLILQQQKLRYDC